MAREQDSGAFAAANDKFSVLMSVITLLTCGTVTTLFKGFRPYRFQRQERYF